MDDYTDIKTATRGPPQLTIICIPACLHKNFPFDLTIQAPDLFIDFVWRCDQRIKFNNDDVGMFLAEFGIDNAVFPAQLFLDPVFVILVLGLGCCQVQFKPKFMC